MNKAIKKIELDLGGKVVSLTPQQAQNLKDALDDLFGIEPWPPRWEWRREPYDSGTVYGCSCDDEDGTLRLTG